MPPNTNPAPEMLPLITDLPGDALNAAIEAARVASPVVDGPHGARHIFVPRGFRLEDVSDQHAMPPYATGHVIVDDRASLVAYANRFSDKRSVIIADYDAGKISARLDWHSGNDAGLAPQPRVHTAALQLRPSEEFARWDAFEGDMHKQVEFAAFLEENAVDVVDPESAVLIEISRDLEAMQGVTFKSSNRLDSGDRAFVYENETHVRGEVKVPREFTLEVPLYNGEPPILIRCALRFRVTPAGLLLGFQWRRVEYARRSHFTQIATAAAEDTGLPVFFGRATV
jgi:uncharacterized protein YfdQ (DUF2303 family)